MQEIAPTSFFENCPVPHEYISPLADVALCSICMEVLERPLELSCSKLACVECLIKQLQEGNLTCPYTNHPLTTDFVRSPSSVTMGILGQLPVRCGLCRHQVQTGNFKRHAESRCNLLGVADSPSKLTVGDILKTKSAPTPAERRVAGQIIKRMLNTASGIVQVPSGSHGQPLTLVQVPACRKTSTEASPHTVLRRSHHLAQVREHVSGGTSLEQMESEIRCLSKQERQQVLKGASLPIEIPAEHVLAMKADLSLPWNKLREISR